MADFTREEVIEIVLNRKKCEGADLKYLDLSEVNLKGAGLRGAFLWDANLTRAYLVGAMYNANTKWSEDFDPVAAGAVLVED